MGITTALHLAFLLDESLSFAEHSVFYYIYFIFLHILLSEQNMQEYKISVLVAALLLKLI